jgi:hypothetical protein
MMAELAYSDALVEIREVYDGEHVPAEDLDAGDEVLDELSRRGEIVEFDDGYVPTEAV